MTIKEISNISRELVDEIERVIVGKREVIEKVEREIGTFGLIRRGGRKLCDQAGMRQSVARAKFRARNKAGLFSSR